MIRCEGGGSNVQSSLIVAESAAAIVRTTSFTSAVLVAVNLGSKLVDCGESWPFCIDMKSKVATIYT